jgi:hypothetical protein
LKFAGYTTSTSVYEAVYLGIINMAGAGIAMLVLDKLGRRLPMIAGTAGCVLGHIGLGWFFHTSAAFQHANASIALALVMWYLLCSEISLGPIFWVMIAEIYPLRSRAKAMAAATMVNWTFNFLVSYFFLQMTNSISKAGTFWLYAGLGVAAIAFFALKLPRPRAAVWRRSSARSAANRRTPRRKRPELTGRQLVSDWRIRSFWGFAVWSGWLRRPGPVVMMSGCWICRSSAMTISGGSCGSSGPRRWGSG